MDTWTRETQNRTKRTADRTGEAWTSADLELLTAFADEPVEEIARATGRTYFAVATMRQLVAAGRAHAGRVAASDRPYRGWLEGDGDE